MSFTARQLIYKRILYCAWPSNRVIVDRKIFELAANLIAGDYHE